MHHCAFEYDSFADLMSSFDRLRKAGLEPAFCLDHGLTISLYYTDPEGNFVELQSDNFSDWRLSGEFMRTSADFAANPIGTFFDPARVYEQFQGGRRIQDPAEIDSRWSLPARQDSRPWPADPVNWSSGRNTRAIAFGR